MLNTKYIIGQDGQVNINEDAMGPAWFVQNVIPVQSPDAEYRQLENLNVSTSAVVNEEEYGSVLDDQLEYSVGSVVRVQSIPDDLIYQTQNEGVGLLVFSEIFYDGPGWVATIDGEEVPLIRANFLLRAVKVPAGEHEVRLRFRPNSYFLGEKISFGSSLFVGLLMLFYFFGYKRKQNL